MKTVYLAASGDLRLSANQTCQAAQAALEQQFIEACQRAGAKVKRAHPYDPEKKHGFIDSQKMGLEVFRAIPKDAPVVVAEAVWQYSHHVLPGLLDHTGPILTVSNWSGEWPGLVGMLNLNGCLTKAGRKYSSLWSEDFAAPEFAKGLRSWLSEGTVKHDLSHVRRYSAKAAQAGAAKIGARFAQEFAGKKSIMGIFDEGCMGMYNAIIQDELLFPLGVFKERLSQAALYAKTRTVSEAEARAVYDWLLGRGMTFHLGRDEATELTERQVLDQCRMYVAALRMADEFGCATIGIQYQQGLKDLLPASDLVEGLLNNVDRPPVKAEGSDRELYPGAALPHFNEVDECAGVDALVTNGLWTKLGYSPETTLHDVRWGRAFQGDGVDGFVWVLEISGSVPPAHLEGGYRGASSERQPPMFFPMGGGTIKGVSRPGEVVWSRVFVDKGQLCCDVGLGESVALPREEMEERWRLTTPQWPIMNLVMRGVSRDQFMARHKANHIQVAYAPDRAGARKALWAKAAAFDALGLKVCICGEV
ncbi:MAG TPA: hypothetical protein VMU15_06775 [Anaeromyxobacter sp.]|nr:hypothetical protein [Anaeromyxobacter sp.]